MKVLLDVSNLGLSYGSTLTRTGIFRATESLVREILERPDLEVWFAALDSYVSEVQLARYDRAVGGLLGQRMLPAWQGWGTTVASSVDLVEDLERAGEDTPSGKRITAELALLNRLARPLPIEGEFDVLHSLRHPLASPDRVRARARFLTIHDMVPLLFPEFTEDRFVVQHHAVLNSLDAARDRVICNSMCTKTDVCRIMSLEAERAFVTPFAADPDIFRPERDPGRMAEVLDRLGLGGRDYILSLSTIEPRKNLSLLLRSFFSLIDRGEPSDVSLVLVGPTGWKSGPFFQGLDARPDLKERVILTGYVPDEELSAVYSGARAFVYPSIYEGFGLPPLEAMQCGVPVITSSTSSLPEVVGSAAITVDPQDEDGLALAIHRVLTDKELAGELARKGVERSREFSWARTVEATVAAYGATLDMPPPSTEMPPPPTSPRDNP